MEIIRKYLDKQKIKVAEVYDFENEKVKYSEKIKNHRKIEKLGREEIVRLYISAKLVNELGYKLENIEMEKEYGAGRPKKIKPRIDIIVRDNSGNVFLYIETKSAKEYEKNQDEVIEDQLFGLASLEKGKGNKIKYLLLYSMEIIENEIKDRCLLIDYEKFPSFNTWKETRDIIDEIPKNYERAQKRPYVKRWRKRFGKEVYP
ncbi:MAG: type I restriction enzyme HsdR N-terminal domain-containing protein [Candidatus Moeniiplasma glomeromycotorum]|nr:type I restriction enzyme HsdR N-terminal domain-containing protein [Candidatus Moeniiplasma glomeromycotorum]MCE8168423.1 type I restriction enzyme HsdR N-terminal domain-containing protein [Candidatus Moeniiplasma glomeromycotorum]MCE8169945.1 type I restriction enzyme HsdR N-terminal domain-containing protein [Candidatus Moeniiplasma glomeromycotorum]